MTHSARARVYARSAQCVACARVRGATACELLVSGRTSTDLFGRTANAPLRFEAPGPVPFAYRETLNPKQYPSKKP